MKFHKMTSVRVALSVTGEGQWQQLPVAEMTIAIDDPGSFPGLVDNVNCAMVAIRTHLDAIQKIPSEQIVSQWRAHAAALMAQKEEADKHKENGEVWAIQNRATAAESENACLKKQVQQLIDQLSRNIEQEREEGSL